jgi:phosphoglucosamine mutase
VNDKFAAIHDAAVRAAVQKAEREIGTGGRVLLRASGTEALVRVMVECGSEEECKLYAERIARVITESEGGL